MWRGAKNHIEIVRVREGKAERKDRNIVVGKMLKTVSKQEKFTSAACRLKKEFQEVGGKMERL